VLVYRRRVLGHLSIPAFGMAYLSALPSERAVRARWEWGREPAERLILRRLQRSPGDRSLPPSPPDRHDEIPPWRADCRAPHEAFVQHANPAWRITEHRVRKHVATALQLEEAAASFARASFAVLCKWHEKKCSDRDRK